MPALDLCVCVCVYVCVCVCECFDYIGMKNVQSPWSAITSVWYILTDTFSCARTLTWWGQCSATYRLTDRKTNNKAAKELICVCCRDPRCGGSLPELPSQDPTVRAHQHRPNHPESGLVCLRGDAHQRGHGEGENEKVRPIMFLLFWLFSVFTGTQGETRAGQVEETTKKLRHKRR